MTTDPASTTNAPGDPGQGPRLALLEFLTECDRVNERSVLFPFLQGVAGERGWPVRWWFARSPFGRHRDRLGGRLVFADPDPDLRSRIAAMVREFRPSHLVVSEETSPETEAALREAGPPGMRLLFMPSPKEFHFRRDEFAVGPDPILARVAQNELEVADRWYFARPYWFLRFLGVEDPAEGERFFVEHVPPDYRAFPVDDAARMTPSSLVLLGGVSCGGRPSVTRNPLFRGVDLSECRITTGCSYCGGSPTPPLHSAGLDRVRVAESQLRAIRSMPPGENLRDHHSYIVYDYFMLKDLDRFCRMVLALGLPPSTFYLSPRLDDVLREREALERAFPTLLDAGHVLKTLIMGIETFSPAEMARFNKHLSLRHVEEVMALEEEWKRRHPNAREFFHGEGARSAWSFIFYTPWTTPEDIRINLMEGRRLGLDPRGYWLVSTLLMLRGLAISALARAQGGIVSDQYGDRGILYVPVTRFDDLFGALPWRFLDDRTALCFRLLVRAYAAWHDGEEDWFFRGDPEFPWVLDLVRGARFLPLDLAQAILDLVEERGVSADPRSLLADALARAEAACPDEEDPRPIHRILRESSAPPPSNETLEAPIRDLLAVPPGRLAEFPEARAVRDVAALLARGLPGDLARARIVGARPRGPDPVLPLVLDVNLGGRLLTLDLLPAGPGGESWLSSRSFRLSFRRETPPSEADRSVLTFLLALLEQRMEKRVVRSRPGRPT